MTAYGPQRVAEVAGKRDPLDDAKGVNDMRFTAEWWAYWAGVGAVGLTAAAAVAGLVAWYFSNQASAVKDARSRALELRVSEQQQRAANAEADLARLRIAMADRRLTTNQQQQLTTSIAPHVVSGYTVLVRSGRGDLEAEALGVDIEVALRRAGLIVTREIAGNSSSPGIFVACGEKEGRDFGVALTAALQTTGLAVAPFTNTGCGGTTDIYIGPKPAPSVSAQPGT